MKITHKQTLQSAVVLLCAAALKWFYANAEADQLRWVLAPTTALVELISGASFEFESHAGYLSRERNFLIAPSCAGVNFLLTAFLLLALKRLARGEMRWRFISAAALAAFLATLVANTVRISIALWIRASVESDSWLHSAQFHRLEGICVYFGFLLLLFALSERLSSVKQYALWPLLVYYATTLGLPFVNGAFRQGSIFWENSLAVVLLPLLLLLPFAALRRLSLR
jgi:exosortase K